MMLKKRKQMIALMMAGVMAAGIGTAVIPASVGHAENANTESTENSKDRYQYYTKEEVDGDYDSIIDNETGLAFSVINGELRVDGFIAPDEDYSDKITDLVIPSEIKGYKVTKIATSAFEALPNLTSVTIPGTITNKNLAINESESVFSDCKKLEKVVFKNGVTRVPPTWFSGCSKLTDITFPKSLKKIGSEAFAGTGVKELVFESNITNVGQSAFENCKNLKSITIKSPRVFYAGGDAFKGCTSLTDIYCDGTSTDDFSARFGQAFSKSILKKVTFHTNTPNAPKITWDKKNPLMVKGKTVKVKYSVLKKQDQTIKRSSAVKVSKAEGKVTYSKKSGNKNITVNKTTGNLTVKKGLAKGTYTVKVNVKAAGKRYMNEEERSAIDYLPLTKTAVVTIKVA